MRVRAAQADDLDAIAQLALLHTVGGNPATFVDSFRQDLETDERCLLVATEGQVVIGYGRVWWFEPELDHPANIAPPGYYLLGLVIDPDHRRQGVGSELTAARLAWARDCGAPEVWYFTNANNVASQRLHHRFGFQEVTRDFAFPGVTFAGGVGSLARSDLNDLASASVALLRP